uniref:Small ribosomal subunit protein bS20c n=2 Tax=Kappaphycus TaxID=38543 RepID=A0A2H4FGC0_9FLOR|nr:30S ribosomal protein S20 [Kappaphycus striatus]
MTNNVSAAKKIQVSLRNRIRNKLYRSTIKTLTKKYFKSLNQLNDSNYNEVLSNLSSVYSRIDKAVKKGVLHRNNGARKKSSLARAMKNILK